FSARGSCTPRASSTDQATGSTWIGRRLGTRSWARAAAIARARSASPIGRAPSETWARTRWLCIWPIEVETTTPDTGAPAARSTAWPMAWAASSMLTIAPPRTPRDCTWLAPATRTVRSAWRTPSGFMMKQATLEAPRSSAATTGTRGPARPVRPSAAVVARPSRAMTHLEPEHLRLGASVALGPHRHRPGGAQVDPGKAQIQQPLALIQRVQLDQGGFLAGGRQLDQAAVLQPQVPAPLVDPHQ